MKRLLFTSERDLAGAVAATRAVIAQHAVVAVPTETFYGLAVPPDDAAAVARVFALKGRPADKALLVVGASVEQLAALVRLDAPWRARLAAAWPAPLTVVLPRQPAVAGGGTLAVRVPAHPLLRALLGQVGPLTATSANRSGEPPCADPDDVVAALGAEVALLLDGGATPGGPPTTLLDLTASPPRVLRPGAWLPPAAWRVKAR